MLYFVSFARRWRRMERRRYWVRERSDWRIESFRFVVWLLEVEGWWWWREGSEAEKERSSIVEIWFV